MNINNVSVPPQEVFTGQVRLAEQSPEHMTPPYTIHTTVAQKLHHRGELKEVTKKDHQLYGRG